MFGDDMLGGKNRLESCFLAKNFFNQLYPTTNLHLREGMSYEGRVLSQEKNFEETIEEVYSGDIITDAGKAVADWTSRIRLQDAWWVRSSTLMGAASWGGGGIDIDVFKIAEEYVRGDLVDLYMSRNGLNRKLNIGQLMTLERKKNHCQNMGLRQIISIKFWKENRRLYNEYELAGYPEHYDEGQGKDNEEILDFAFKKLRDYNSWLIGEEKF